MRKFLMVTHGGFAKGIQHSIGLFLGEKNNFSAISAYMDDTPVQDQIESYMNALDVNDELIILTDIVGGSVNQLMVPYLVRNNTYLISGFNFPLLLELSVLPEGSLDSKTLKELIENNKNTMVLVENSMLDNKFRDDDE